MSDILTPPKAFYKNVEVQVLETYPDGRAFVQVVDPNQNLVINEGNGALAICPQGVVQTADITITA